MEASATVTTEMSAVPPFLSSGFNPVIEGNAPAVRGPREAADGERPGGERTRGARRDIERKKMCHPVILFDHPKLTVFLVAILDRGRLRLGGAVGDGFPVGGPREGGDAVLERGQRLGFTALWADRIAAACRYDPR